MGEHIAHARPPRGRGRRIFWNTVGVIGESGRGKHVYIALFAAAGVLHLASWVLSMMYF